ncbi:prephenate dehydrogenase/arogenate dehydrogenase family protein [Gottschalkiaceae bacterium SANA]|nr:prephenate dehydrogenase/arogenate dehydrogenase family protein [Gottschalkiaceae bacterium SANA]
MESDFKRILVVGLGLMGGSFAKAIRYAVPAIKMDGLDLDCKSVEAAKALGVIDAGFCQTQEEKYDLIVLATPLGAYSTIINQLIPWMSEGALVTDLGSVKGRVHREVEPLLPDFVSFLGGHPMCGAEFNGFSASRTDLFDGKVFFLTGQTNSAIVKAYIRILQAIDVQIVKTSPAEHDTMVAKTSHMPHLSAVLLSSLLESAETCKNYIGEGFRDSTRIAAGDPRVWRDIFLYNAPAILEDLEVFQNKLNHLKDCLKSENGTEILETLAISKGIQEGIKE